MVVEVEGGGDVAGELVLAEGDELANTFDFSQFSIALEIWMRGEVLSRTASSWSASAAA